MCFNWFVNKNVVSILTRDIKGILSIEIRSEF